MKKINISKLETKYLIDDGKHTISVILHHAFPKSSLSIFRQEYFNQPFDFIKSDPSTVKAIANLLRKATELTKGRE